MKSILLMCATIWFMSGCSTSGSIMASNLAPPMFDRLPGVGELYSPEISIGYTGEIRKLEEVAVITRLNTLYITSINGNSDFTKINYPKKKYIMDFKGNQFHLLPGTYTMGFCFKYFNSTQGATCATTITKTMHLSAGQRVVLYIDYPSRDTWTVKERLMTSNELTALEKNFNKHVLNIN